MRKIKFRAKVIKTGRWVYGINYFMEVNEYTYSLDYFFSETIQNLIDKSTITQFTGLKNKNGKEIYEGDIIKWYNGKDEVIFEDGTFKFNIYRLCENELLNKNCKVIGNKFENKELLK